MKVPKVKFLLFCALVLLIGSASAAFGDWNEGDPYKMHYPQLPDPFGWDVFVDITGAWGWEYPSEGVGDDWLCTGTGPVSDIHFWVSWNVDANSPIETVTAQIYSNEPVGPGGFSQPRDLLWERTFQAGEFNIRWYDSGDQGWYDPWYPEGPLILPNEHHEIYQINITDINEPFIQQQGQIYWLVLGITAEEPAIGWKTSLDRYADDAVYMMDGVWQELTDPCTAVSMDMAFVITGPEQEEIVKWEQPPCLDDPELCMDVDATDDDWLYAPPQALADDFQCLNTGLITDIHIWGSWLYDTPPIPPLDPNHVWFTLCLYSNDPFGANGWSEPDELLWTKEFHEGEFSVEMFAEGPEGFYIPCIEYYEPYADSICWRYNFYIDPCEAFVQKKGTIYWLAVQAHIYEPQPVPVRFGWKNSSEQRYDDAVWTVGFLPYDLMQPWVELYNPITMESMDLAFQITTTELEEPKPMMMPHTKWSQPPIEKSQPAALLYASSPGMGTSSLSTVDPYTGLVTIIGPFIPPPIGNITEIEWSPDGSTLYGTEGMGISMIHTIDPTTGIILSSVAQNPPGTALQGLEFDAGGTLLATSFPGIGISDLVQVDTATGVLTTIGATGYGQIGGLAFDSGFNTLYGITSGRMVPPILLSVNPSTGVATQIAVTTMNTYAASLEFTADGRLVTAGGDGNFYEINPSNGVATLIGPMVNEPILSGLSLRPTHPVYCGWDEESHDAIEPGTPTIKVVADDFHCIGSMPVTSIHLWGSYFDWEWSWAHGTLPPVLPEKWWIGFWSNVPAMMPPYYLPYSYPDKLLHSITIPANRVDFDEVGSDEYYGYFPYDICYQYNIELKPDEVFWQDDFNEMTYDDVYWISIVAEYSDVVEPYNPWGWKSRPWSWGDDAVTFTLPIKPDEGFVNDPFEVIPIVDPYWNESFDMSFELDTDPDYIKWEQLYTGIHDWPHYEDIPSMAVTDVAPTIKYAQQPDLAPTGMDVLVGPLSYDGVNAYEKFLADDFLCTDTGRITDIHLWTSYNWDIRITDIPWFSLVIYENVPADEFNPYSRPGAVLWDAYLRPTYEWIYAGADESFYDPNPDEIIGLDSMVWRFDFEIDPAEAFVQQEGEIYWLGVHHSFDLNNDGLVNIIDLTILANVWPAACGWKTSSEHFEDNAVWTDVLTFMENPHVVPSGDIWKPLFYPPGHQLEGRSIDMAFEITTQQSEPDISYLAADDWKCERRTPVEALAWWGSYQGYEYPACCDPVMTLPVPPDYFRLNIWTDEPADACIPGSYSHPKEIIWQYDAYDYDEVLVGYDKFPEGEPCEPVFRYSVRLPEDAWFKQPEVNDIFWLSIVAVYDTNIPNYDWGWTNHEYMFNDDAVEGFYDPPGGWYWYEIFDQTGTSADLSFMLFTDPNDCIECADYNRDGIVNFYDYAIFALDWMWTGPAGGYANGDLNCNGQVDFEDLEKFCLQWLNSCP